MIRKGDDHKKTYNVFGEIYIMGPGLKVWAVLLLGVHFRRNVPMKQQIQLLLPGEP